MLADQTTEYLSLQDATVVRAPKPKASRSNRVLVLVDDTRVLLPIARSLGRRGIAVDVAWCSPQALALRSRYVRTLHELPAPSPANTAWQQELSKLIEKHEYDMVLPATEQAAQAFHRTREDWQDQRSICLLNETAFSIASDKSQTQQLAKSLQVSIPATVMVNNAKQFQDALERFEGAAVVKPMKSFSAAEPSEKGIARRLESIQEGKDFAAQKNRAPWNLLVQEIVAGTGVGVEVLADHGQILVAFQHRRLHETTGYGSMYRESEPLSPRMLDAVKTLAKATDFTGVGMFEFRRDDRSGEFALIEINGRFWGSLGLALTAGVDFPYYLYQWHVEGRDVFPQQYCAGLRCRDLSGDLRWIYRSLKGTRPAVSDSTEEGYGWELNSVSRLRALGDLLKLASPRDRIDSFAWDDPQPALSEMWRLGSSAIKRLYPGRSK